jgi:hypothetical protein
MNTNQIHEFQVALGQLILALTFVAALMWWLFGWPAGNHRLNQISYALNARIFSTATADKIQTFEKRWQLEALTKWIMGGVLVFGVFAGIFLCGYVLGRVQWHF